MKREYCAVADQLDEPTERLEGGYTLRGNQEDTKLYKEIKE